jgi:acetylornithine/N-succinyldiaminopimelate aminotransferase
VTLTASAPLLPAYPPRAPVTFVRGQGCRLFADDGRSYLDFGAGIAVVALGHCHPAPLAAAQAQLERLWHASNLYWTAPMAELAERLSARFGGARAFFCNSGTEANEAALKYARKATGTPGVLALEGSFHGRTIGSLSVTGQPAKRAPFEPLLAHVAFARPNDVGSLRAAATPETGLVLLEPIQGEGGVRPLEPAFLEAAAALAGELGALLCFDEVQSGVGRTGSFFAFEQLGVRPELVSLAKGLANGLPIGALLVADGAPEGFGPGDHGATFGGNCVACAAACAVCDTLDDELLASVRERGRQLAAGLAALRGVVEVRGSGLLLGADLDRGAASVVDACRDAGLVVLAAGERILRLAPPLTVSEGEVEEALATLKEVLG